MEVWAKMVFIRNEKEMYGKDKQIRTVKGFLWFVFVRGGLLFGVMLFIPASITGSILIEVTNGWLFPYNRFSAQEMEQWTNVWFIVKRVLLFFAVGSVCGFAFWIIHVAGLAKSKDR